MYVAVAPTLLPVDVTPPLAGETGPSQVGEGSSTNGQVYYCADRCTLHTELLYSPALISKHMHINSFGRIVLQQCMTTVEQTAILPQTRSLKVASNVVLVALIGRSQIEWCKLIGVASCPTGGGL